MEESKIPISILYMNLEAIRMKDRPINGWQNEVMMEAHENGKKS
jgi:hypothetical protein